MRAADWSGLQVPDVSLSSVDKNNPWGTLGELLEFRSHRGLLVIIYTHVSKKGAENIQRTENLSVPTSVRGEDCGHQQRRPQ